MAWIDQTSPDLTSFASICSHVTPDRFAKAHLRMLNAYVSYAQATSHVGLHIHPLHLRFLRINVHDDASFANNWDDITPLGYIVMLTDDSSVDSSVYFSSKKSHRVVRSVIGGDLYPLDDATDLVFVMKRDLEADLYSPIHFITMTDLLSIFNVVIRSST